MAGEPQGVSSYTVGPEAAGQRLDVYIAEAAPGVSRAKVQKLIEAGEVSLNGAPGKARDRVRPGDAVRVIWPAPPPSALLPVAMPLAIVYEDDDLLVLDKPAGLAVHPGAGDHGPTLVQGLLAHCGKLGTPAVADPTAWARPGIVHRLDKDTSGLMVCAKTDRAHAALARQFHDKTTLVREYAALLDGVLSAEPLPFASYLRRDPKDRLRFASLSAADYQALGAPAGCRLARSLFKSDVIYGNRLTLATVRLYTGRTHQIRVHAQALGAPVVGDQLYHRVTQLPVSFAAEVRAQVGALTRQMLHAKTLVFRHPGDARECAYSSSLPVDFRNIIDILSPYSRAAAKPI